MTDMEAVEVAERAGRLYVPTRSLSDKDDVPRPFATAPTARCRALQDAYRAAVDASIEAAQVLDELTVAARAPSMTLALARAATPLQSNRRLGQSQLDNDKLRDAPPANVPFRHSRASTGKAGPLEQTLIHRRVTDPVILLRAAVIDNAARHLIIQAENEMPESGSSDTRESGQRAAHGPAELAAQSFPRSPVTRPSAEIRRTRPDSLSVPATVSRAESHSRGSGRHS